MRKKQKELRKIDLTDEEKKQLKRISRNELLFDVISFLLIMAAAALAFLFGFNILGH